MLLTDWLTTGIDAVAHGLNTPALFVKGFLAVLLVSLVCGMVGSLVVGNRMAFFSDALAHCAFAGVALGLLLATTFGARRGDPVFEWLLPLVMVGFGGLVGLAIAYVRERTSLASDTVIGVFFAGAIGFGAVLLTALRQRTRFDPEQFMFGSPLFVEPIDLLFLGLLVVGVVVVLVLHYNAVVFASFNPSLARSRRVPLRLYNYLFIVLLAFVVNLSIRAVGALLINALLIVPAAAAANLARNLREMFWLSVILSVGSGLGGLWLSFNVRLPVGPGEPLEFGPAGLIVCVSVLLFFLSMPLGALLRGRQPA
jgi:zinc transport system permease protein